MKKTILTLTFCLTVLLVFSQQSVLSSGNNSESSSGKITYSVGLIHYKEASGTGGTSSVGSQIPFEIIETLSLDDQNLIAVKLYPNPTTNAVFLSLKQNERFDYKLSDISGRDILKGKTSGKQTKINLRGIKTSIYILNIYKDSKLYESYKIIKK